MTLDVLLSPKLNPTLKIVQSNKEVEQSFLLRRSYPLLAQIDINIEQSFRSMVSLVARACSYCLTAKMTKWK